MALLIVSVFVVSRIISTNEVAPTDSDAAASCNMYASPNGREENTGKSASSPLTLDEANMQAVPGSVVCLMDGTYLRTKPLYIAQSGTNSAWIVYKAEHPHKAIIKWNTREGDDMFQMTKGNPGTSYIEVSDLVFDGSYNGVNTAKNAIHGHVGTHHLKVLNNIMKNLKGSGIGMGESDYNLIVGNRIHHVGNYTSDKEDGWGSGITFNESKWFDNYSGIHSYIIGNVISGLVDGSYHNTDGNGIIMDKGGNTPPTLILNNVIYQSGGRCIHNLEASNIWVVNNTCYSNSLDSRVADTGSVGEFTNQNSKNSYFVNNVVYAWTKGYTFMNSPEAQNIRYAGNVSFGGKGATGLASSIVRDVKQINNIDPQFVSALKMDPNADGQYKNALDPLQLTTQFNLRSTSPAINVGVEPTTLTSDANLKRDLAKYIYKDIDGRARPQGTAFDAGAYEYIQEKQTQQPIASGSPTFGGPTTPPRSPSATGSTLVVYAGSSPVNGVYASMDLYVSNVKVKTWTNVKADEVNLKPLPYTYNSPTKLTRSQIKIQYTNDATNSDRTQDRNLYIDKIVIDGVSYETEASTTYSTGVYTQSVGCIAGYKKSQLLSCNGYFQY